MDAGYDSEAVRRLAARAADDPFFLAHRLAGYARANGVDDARLVDLLSTTAAGLCGMRLCRSPRDAADAERIAARFGADAGMLRLICGV